MPESGSERRKPAAASTRSHGRRHRLVCSSANRCGGDIPSHTPKSYWAIRALDRYRWHSTHLRVTAMYFCGVSSKSLIQRPSRDGHLSFTLKLTVTVSTNRVGTPFKKSG